MDINKLRFCLSIKETGETIIALITEDSGGTITYSMDVPTFTKYANKKVRINNEKQQISGD